jgi:hypothetical protein
MVLTTITVSGIARSLVTNFVATHASFVDEPTTIKAALPVSLARAVPAESEWDIPVADGRWALAEAPSTQTERHMNKKLPMRVLIKLVDLAK